LFACLARFAAPLFAFVLLAQTATGEVAAEREDLNALRVRIDALQRELSASEASRSEAADQLRASERLISEAGRKRFALKAEKTRLTRTLSELSRKSDTLEATLSRQRAQLERLVYRQYLRGSPDPLRLLLNGGDPSQLSRDLYYLARVAQARRRLFSDAQETLRQQQALAQETRARAEELARVAREQEEEQEKLVRQKRERQTVFASIASKVRAQKQEIGALQRDEKRLARLVERLTRLLAEREKEGKKTAREDPAGQSGTRHPASAAEGTITLPLAGENRFLPTATSGAFARQQGRLRLPARGEILGRFGAARAGGGVWKGLYIRAPEGNEVRAVANGRVVYSEWMRGFGNLLILDHGAGYLTVYGNNQSLLKTVGDRVVGGEVVGTVGSSGGEAHSGLYFEIRHQGAALDPMKWVSLK
jgi:septal ring factor EnvC (AmiA/AmiB activator)